MTSQIPKLHSVWQDRNGNGLYRVHDLTNEFGAPELPIRVSCTGSDDRRWSLTLEDWHASMAPADLPWTTPPDLTPEDDQKQVA